MVPTTTCDLSQEAEAGLARAQADLAETQQQGDSELTRLGSEWDNTKQSLEDLEVWAVLAHLLAPIDIAASFACCQLMSPLSLQMSQCTCEVDPAKLLPIMLVCTVKSSKAMLFNKSNLGSSFSTAN